MGRLAREKAARRAARKGAASGSNSNSGSGSSSSSSGSSTAPPPPLSKKRRLTRADYAALAIAPPGYEGPPPPPGAGGICGRCNRPLYAYESTITDQATGLLCCMPCLGLRPGDPCPCGCGDPVVCPDIPPPPSSSSANADADADAVAADAAPNTGGSGAAATAVPTAAPGFLMQPGFMEWMADRMVEPSTRIDMDARRAQRHIENQRPSAPCDGCGNPMPAAGRCDECRANGMWYCAACHDCLEDLSRRKINAAAENQKASAPCDGCGCDMLSGDRCGDCRARGLWMCAACHARLICMAGRRAANGPAAGAGAGRPTEIIRQWGDAKP